MNEITASDVTEKRVAELRAAADSLWAWGWYDLADACRAQLRSVQS